ncbi:MAG: exosortase H-associated membrane protein [Thiolinea sp.]
MANTFFNKLFLASNVSPQLLLIRTLFWLPALLGLWYLLAPWLNRTALELGEILIPLALPNLVEDTSSQHSMLIVNTLLGANHSSEIPAGLWRFSSEFFTGSTSYPLLLTINVNSLVYSYGLPVLAALTLAAPSKVSAKLYTLGLGYLLVTCIIVWGLYFNTAILLAIRLDASFTGQAKTLWPLLNETYIQAFISLGYRFGLLIFPVVLPIMLWAQLNPKILHQLIHGFTDSPKPPTQ